MSAVQEEDIADMQQDYDKVMFYVKELFSHFNYSNQIVIMKAKPTPEDAVMENSSEVTRQEPLLNTEQIAVRFTGLGDKIANYGKYASAVVINSENTLMVAENTSSEMLELEKNIEKVRKTMKEPYFLTGKAIDEYAKLLMEPLGKSRSKVNGDIGNYKTVQAAFAKEKADKQQQELKKIEDAKLVEIDKIARIEQQLNARLYGGHWMNKNGLRQSSAGCISEEQCDELAILIAEKVPGANSYTYYGEKHEEMISEIKKRIASHKVNLHNVNADSRGVRTEAMERIQSAKVTADVNLIETKERNEKQVEKEIKREEKAIIGVVRDTRKGLKKTLKFVIIEPDKVDKQFWMIDEEKIRYYMNQHNEEIKEDLQNHKDSLPGIKFLIDENYASQ